MPSAAMLIFDFEGVQPSLILRMPFEVMRRLTDSQASEAVPGAPERRSLGNAVVTSTDGDWSQPLRC